MLHRSSDGAQICLGPVRHTHTFTPLPLSAVFCGPGLSAMKSLRTRLDNRPG